MANPEHIEIVKQGAGAIAKWRADHPDATFELAKANLSKTQLGGVDLSGANLSRANFSKADLSGANLSRAHLSRADLSEANLNGANLSKAYLNRADLGNAYLSRINLGGAYLGFANLSRAYLGLADLTGTNLSGAELIGTVVVSSNLTETDFVEARFGETRLAGVDLSKASGLEQARHSGPSTIGIDTLHASLGKIPEKFLRGCGALETAVALEKALPSEPADFYSCFISHSHEDREFARHLLLALQDQGVRCWLDSHELHPSDDMHDGVERGIKLWDKVILCASKNSLTSWWIDREIEGAFQKEEELLEKHEQRQLALIPLDLDGYLGDGWQSANASAIRNRSVADFAGWESDRSLFERELEKLVSSLQMRESEPDVPPPPKQLPAPKHLTIPKRSSVPKTIA